MTVLLNGGPLPSGVTSAAASLLSRSARPGLLLCGISAALAVALAGCQPSRPPGTLIVATKSRIVSLDPAKASRIGEQQLLSALGDPLSAISAEGRIEPRLAAALPELSEDG